MSIAFQDASLYGGIRQDRFFDPLFIFGTAFVALAMYSVAQMDSVPFSVMLVIYATFIAQPHFFATYTRTAFSLEMFKKNIFMMAVLPVLVLSVLIGLYKMFGMWIYMSLYMYVQWFHFTRQSYGISRIYRWKSKVPVSDDLLTGLALFSIPVWGIIQWSVMQPATYLGQPVKTFDIPAVLDPIAGWVSGALVLAWALNRLLQWKKGQLPVAHTLYMLTHFAMFGISYILIDIIELGWMTIGVWHSAQYLMFVWTYNEQKAAREHAAKPSLMSNPAFYGTLLFFFSLAFFGAAAWIEGIVEKQILVPALVLSGVIPFHHYIVDAIIWRKPKAAPVRA